MRYLQAGPQAGTLIRRVIRFFDDQRITRPITSDILIAVSGGADSVALSHLLVHYGRKIADPACFILLHVNHRWRGAESDADARFVQSLGEGWGVRTHIHSLEAVSAEQLRRQRLSPEEAARMGRRAIFEAQASAHRAWILTAHHQDDLAETVLWRICSGAPLNVCGGILPRHGAELRPLLQVSRAQLRLYLLETEQSFREDATNGEGFLLRAILRRQLIPELRRIFPRALEHLAQHGQLIRSHFGGSLEVPDIHSN